MAEPEEGLYGPSPSAFSERVVEILGDSQDTYVQRNAVYKDNFLVVGQLMKILFPEGVKLETEHDFNRWHIFELIIVKLTRYTQNYATGGHEDSITDMIPYLAILQGIDDAEREKQDEPAEDDEEPESRVHNATPSSSTRNSSKCVFCDLLVSWSDEGGIWLHEAAKRPIHDGRGPG
jgi:hypothetical protein